MPRPLQILIVEDNLTHQLLTEYILKRSRVDAEFIIVRDGQEALDYLNRSAPAGDRPKPNLILLDLNLPKRDGRELLKLIRESPEWRVIPVVVVSTSDREEDVTFAMKTGAVAYISKSSGFDRLSEQLGGILSYARVY
ncbi:MAG TPA: response regulator [Bacteroidota bacterium]|nr:response regulator [Bacteroidota bacterium]